MNNNNNNPNNFMNNNDNNNNNINNNINNFMNKNDNPNNFMNNNNNNPNNFKNNNDNNDNNNNNINNFMNNNNNPNNFVNNNGNNNPSNNFMNINNMPNNNNQSNNQEHPVKYSFSRYKKPTKTGLVNLVESSYLNAVLYLLGNIRNFASYFLNPTNQQNIESNINSNPLSYVIERLFFHLYPYPEKEDGINDIYKPDSLYNLLGTLNPIYKSKHKRNPNELISYIFDTIHQELIQVNKNYQHKNPNIFDKEDVIKIGFDDFQNLNNSIISSSFNWFEIKESRCNLCQNIQYNFYTFNTFQLDILETYLYKKNPITLDDCLQFYSCPKPQKLLCQKCGNFADFIKNTKIYFSPNYFIFSLNRNNLEQKYLNIPFIIEEKINIANYLEKKEAPKDYQLKGILSFSINNKKYVSFCMSPVDKKWYIFNDEKIELTEINQVINFHKINQFIPCILIYQKYEISIK